LPGVNVLIAGTVLGTTTDRDGNFSIRRLPPGSYTLKVSMIGYEMAVRKNVVVLPDKTTTLHFNLVESVIETQEIWVTANKRRQSIQDTPNSVGILTARDFKQKNQVNLDKLLEYASGVNFIGTQINIRGSSGFSYGAGSRVLMLVDGVPVMPGDSGDIKWDLIPATQVDHVEIIKGAGSALYGGSALGGVVNVITKEASSKPTTNLRFSAGVYDKPAYPEWKWTNRLLHYDDVDVDHTRRIGKSDVFFALGRHQSTGYRQNNNNQSVNGSFKIHTRFNGQQNLTFSTNFQAGRWGSGLMWRDQRHALEVSPEAVGDYVVSDKISTNAFHHYVVNKNFSLKTRISYFRNYWKNYFHDNITASIANRYGAEIQGDVQISDENVVTFGTEETWDHVNSGLVGIHDQYVLSGYIQNERKLITNVLLTLGARYDYQFVDVGFNDSEWSPKFGLVWHAQSDLTFRASSGRGFRSASMSERFSDSVYSGLRIIPNLRLKSETAWSHEIGVNYIPSPYFYLDVAAFVSNYNDLIEPEPDETQTVQFINVTRARISGVETNLKFSPWFHNFSFDIGYTYMNPQDLDLDEVLAYRSRHLLNFSGTYTFSFIDFGMDYRYVGRIEKVKLYPMDDRVAQKVMDLRMAVHHGIWTFSTNINNLFNHNHTQMERTIMPIRHYVATLSATF
ncbi:MAG: TonB-dependent receptor, partial [Calditrichaeota bacterium]|nr:TonB-dependent receptor [Calditrichota bacterium]